MSSPFRLARTLSQMGLTEIRWRLRNRAVNELVRARTAVLTPRWRRDSLLRSLDVDTVPPALVDALRRKRWMDAHVLASGFISDQPQRFLIAPRIKESLVGRILTDSPDAARDASTRADRIVAGHYDLLGYTGLQFATSGAQIDWHYDPVHRRTMPEGFWSTVAYLDPAHGDHKIVWELNRHQHWIALARAFWLTSNPRYRDHFIDELASWLACNPPLQGCNWASMLELGMRGLSWTWALNAFVSPDLPDTEPWIVDLLLALDGQMAQIERNLSYYFSPNTHLLGEALALYVTGQALPFLRASVTRAELGRQILVDEIPRQIAADGSHRERSSHYHRYTLDFYLIALTIAEIVNDPAAASFRDAVGRLARAAAALADDRGCLPHFGDDDGGTALPVCGRPLDDIRGSVAIADVLLDRGSDALSEEAHWFLSHPSLRARMRPIAGGPAAALPSTALAGMGYFVSRSPGGVHVVMHAGPHGYLNGGHAHADALSITATLRDRPLLIDPGTGTYTANSGIRDQFRSTKSHNTATLDGRSQSIPDGPFHWKRRAVAKPRTWRAGDGFDYFEASHDGYGPVEHRRHVVAIHDDLLVVMDQIDVPGDVDDRPATRHIVESHWHLDPHWKVQLVPRRATLAWDSARVEVFAPAGQIDHFAADAELGLGWFAPVYGRIEPGSTLRVTQTAELPVWCPAVFSLRLENPIIAVDALTPAGGQQEPTLAERRRGAGLRIVRRRSTDYVLIVDRASPGRFGPATFEEISTDARMCFCRVVSGRVTGVCLVDGAQVTLDRSRSHGSTKPLEMVS